MISTEKSQKDDGIIWQEKNISIIKRNIIIMEFFCLKCFYSPKAKNKLESYKNVFESKDFVM